MSDDASSGCRGQHAGPSLETDEEILKYALNTRIKIVHNLTVGSVIPTEDSDKRFLNDNLAALERTAIARQRVKLEEKAVDNTGGAAALITAVLQQAAGINFNQGMVPGNRPPPRLDDSITIDLIPGETSTAQSTQNYDDFMKKSAQSA